MSSQKRPLVQGDMVHGFCGGIFGRDSFHCKIVEQRGADWAVFRDTDGRVDLATGSDLHNLLEYRDLENPGDVEHTCSGRFEGMDDYGDF